MPTKRKTNSRSRNTRRNTNKQHPKHFAKVYWPYLPIIAVVMFGMVFSGVNPNTRVDNPAILAYSTEMSISGLLSATNQKRAENGLAALSVNGLLNSSAQAKANDMVAKDYWSHASPSGQEPWVFFDSSGYSYSKAGENLAYGFATSSETIVGWMNSPSHRANMLDAEYTEVGFGFKNSENFIETGPETVVVAHYAAPHSIPDPQPEPEPEPEPAGGQAQGTSQSNPPAVAETAPPQEEVVEETGSEDPEGQAVDDDRYNQPVSTDNPVPDDGRSRNITRLQTITDGDAPWSAVALSAAASVVVLAWLLKHALLVKRFLLKGEQFVAHHPLLDLSVVAIAALAVYLSQSSGVVL